MNDHSRRGSRFPVSGRLVAVAAGCALIGGGAAVALASGGSPRQASLGMPAMALYAGMPAATPDSHAPTGASDHWLPIDPWVMQHWLPYDEQRLYAVLGIDRSTLHRWLKVPGHTIAQLAAAHGQANPSQLVDYLLAPRKNSVDPSTYAELQQRTDDTLTQSHLAQHVFFHLFHDPQIAINAQAIFGVSRTEFRSLRRQRLTPAEIGARGGRSRAQVADAVMSVLEASQRVGQAESATTPEQSQAFLAAQRAGLQRWLDKTPRDHGGM